MRHLLGRVINRELGRMLKERTFFFITFLGPLFAFFIVSWIFSSGVPRDLPIAVVDLDHTSLSRKVAQMVDATSIAAVDRSYISLEEARIALKEGKADAVIYIPKDAEKDIFKGQNAKIALYLNNANVITGGLLNSGIRKAIATLSAGISLHSHLQSGETEKQAISNVLPIQLRSVLLFNPFISYAYFLTILLLPVMLTVFTLFGTIYSIGTELQYGTGKDWLGTSDNNITIALVGKILPYTFFYCLVAVFMNLDFFYVLGLPLKGSIFTILISELLLILSYQSMAIVLITLTKNLRLALSLASAYTMLAITYAGFTFPFMAMPEIGWIFSRIFPIVYWVQIFVGQSVRTEPIANGIYQMYYLWGFIILGFLFIPRLKYLLQNEKYWGKI